MHDRTRKYQYDPSFRRWHCSPYCCHVADSWTSPDRPDSKSKEKHSSIPTNWLICNNWDNIKKSSSVPIHRHASQRIRIPREYRIADIDLHNQSSSSRMCNRSKDLDHTYYSRSTFPRRPAFSICVRVWSLLDESGQDLFVAVPLTDVRSYSSNASNALK